MIGEWRGEDERGGEFYCMRRERGGRKTKSLIWKENSGWTGCNAFKTRPRQSVPNPVTYI